MGKSNTAAQFLQAAQTLNWNKIRQRYIAYSTDWANSNRAKELEQAVRRLAGSKQNVAWANEIKRLEVQMKRESQTVLERCVLMGRFKQLVLVADKCLAEEARRQDMENAKKAAAALDEQIVSLQNTKRSIEWVKAVREFVGQYEAVTDSVRTVCLNTRLLDQLKGEAGAYEERHNQALLNSYRQAIANPSDFQRVFELDKTVAADQDMLCSYIPDFFSKWRAVQEKAAASCTEKAKCLYERANYSQALPLLIQAADLGNGQAQLYLGKCYEYGLGVIADNGKAIKLYTEAGDRKIREAFVPLGDVLYREKRYREAVVCYEEAFKCNDPCGSYRLYKCYENGIGVRRDTRKAQELLDRAANAGVPEAMYEYAEKKEQLERRISANRESDLSLGKAALNWYNKAATAGYEPARRKAESLKRELDAKEAAIRAAREERERQEREREEKRRQKEVLDREIDLNYTFALEGDDEAQYQVGMYYFEGRGIEQDYYEAVAWFRKAAAQKNPDAMEKLGDCYYNGYGVAQSYSEAMYWYNEAMRYS